MKLFLDDFRNPDHCFSYVKAMGIRPDVYLGQWEVVRSHNEFVKFIETYGLPEEISFDHDLAEEHYGNEITDSMEWREYHEKQDREMTGYDAAKWLVEYCNQFKLPLPKCYCHSMNPVGRANIMKLLTATKPDSTTGEDKIN